MREHEEMEEILARAQQRGELPEMSNPSTAHRMFGGALFFTVFVIDEPLYDEELTRVVDVLATGLGASRPDRG